MELRCRDYVVERKCDELTMIRPTLFLLLSPKDHDKQAMALSQIELLLSGAISLIRDTGFRCSWCGTKQDESDTICTQCGGSL